MYTKPLFLSILCDAEQNMLKKGEDLYYTFFGIHMPPNSPGNADIS